MAFTEAEIKRFSTAERLAYELLQKSGSSSGGSVTETIPEGRQSIYDYLESALSCLSSIDTSVVAGIAFDKEDGSIIGAQNPLTPEEDRERSYLRRIYKQTCKPKFYKVVYTDFVEIEALNDIFITSISSYPNARVVAQKTFHLTGKYRAIITLESNEPLN